MDNILYVILVVAGILGIGIPVGLFIGRRMVKLSREGKKKED